MSWFNLYWSKEDRELLRIWRNNVGKNVRFIDEGRPDPDADDQPCPFIPILIESNRDPNLDVFSKARGKKKRVVLSASQRQEIFTLKGKHCDHCDNKQTLEIHHIDGDPSNNTLANLQVLCHECHQEIESRMRKP